MNQIQITTIGLLLCSQILSPAAFAQRKIDIETKLISPADGQEIKNGEVFNIVIQLKNNGPDDLKNGDTIIVRIGEEYYPLALNAAIPLNESSIIFDVSRKADIPGSSRAINFCCEILDVNSNGASMGGVPLLVSYDDPNPVNNLACNEIIGGPATDPTSIHQEEVQQNNVKIFPNPAGEKVNIQIGSDYKDELMVRITDISGHVLLKQKYNAAAAQSRRLLLNIGQLPAGVFIVNLQSDTKTVSEKLTVIR